MAVTISAEGKQQKIEAEKILIAVGRKPRTENIGVEKTKIKPERGFIQTDSWMHTAEPGRLCGRRHRPGYATTGPCRRHGGSGCDRENCGQAM